MSERAPAPPSRPQRPGGRRQRSDSLGLDAAAAPVASPTSHSLSFSFSDSASVLRGQMFVNDCQRRREGESGEICSGRGTTEGAGWMLRGRGAMQGRSPMGHEIAAMMGRL